MDIIGEQQFGVDHTVMKRRLDSNGRLLSVNEEQQGGMLPLAHFVNILMPLQCWEDQ